MISGPSLLKLLIIDINLNRCLPFLTQIRNNKLKQRPRLRNPYWFIRKERQAYDDHVSSENRLFLKEVVHDKYGPPAIIKGVQTFSKPTEQLVKVDEIEKAEWSPKYRRTGVIAKKIGQYPLWLKTGKKIFTTLLQVVDNHVVKYIPPESYKPTQKPNVHNINKFGCLLVGAESTDPTLFTKEYCGLFKQSGIIPKKHLCRFLVSPSAALPPGTPLNVTHFKVGDYVDVRGKTVDRGFQGVMKRHGFKGMPATHGVTKTHRRPGNIGGGGEKGRVWPGTKLPGHMGNRWRILKGLRIWRINTKYNVMWVSGMGIAGETNNIVYIYDTILPLKRCLLNPPYPTYLEDETSELNEEILLDEIHNFKNETIMFNPEE